MLRSNINFWEYIPVLLRSKKALILYNGLCLLLVLWALAACAPKNGAKGADGANGLNGSAGTNGIAGANGLNGTDGVNGAAGTSGTNGVDGATGAKGAAGAKGATGPKGASCSILQLPTGAVINCEDGTSAVISNGQNCSEHKHHKKDKHHEK